MTGQGRAPLLGSVANRWRRLPDFLIIGAQRSGTTALFDALSAHPEVRTAARKEVHYFDLHHARGLSWYRSFFPLRGRGGLVGEATPYYLAHPLAAARAAEVLPAVRLVAILREPVDRAWSHWRWNRAEGREDLTFRDALEVEPERLRGEEDRLLAGDDAIGRPHVHQSYLDRGRYAPQLDRWAARFPPDTLLVIRHEDLVADARATLARVQAHLGIGGPALSLTTWRRTDEGPSSTDRRRAEELLGDAPAQLEARYGITWDPA